MIRKKITTALASLAILFGIVGVAVPATVSAASFQQDACSGLSSLGGSDCSNNTAKTTSNTIKNIINLLSVIVGIVTVIMVIVAGFKYITSAGDSSKITSAKNTLVYAIIGIIVVAFSQVIVQFVLSKAG